MSVTAFPSKKNKKEKEKEKRGEKQNTKTHGCDPAIAVFNYSDLNRLAAHLTASQPGLDSTHRFSA